MYISNNEVWFNVTKYNIFVKDLSNVKIAIVDVKGMVCDFCARGIEKTFYDDKLDSMDKNWNNLKKNKLEDIMKFWRKYISPEKWKKEDTLPECCSKLCKIR